VTQKPQRKTQKPTAAASAAIATDEQPAVPPAPPVAPPAAAAAAPEIAPEPAPEPAPAPAPLAALPSRVEGALLGLTRAGIVGWARDLARPEAIVEVVLFGAGQELGRGHAAIFDDDMVRARVGPGIPGFAIRLATLPAGPFPLRLELRDAAGTPLGSPLVVTGADELRPALDPASAMRIEGQVDGMIEGRLLGWAWDVSHPATVLRLDLFDGAKKLASTSADQVREDLRAAGKRDGACGFAFDLPASLLDGRPHSLSVRVEGSTLAIPGGPVTFGPGGAPVLYEEVVAMRTRLDALATQVEKLLSPSGSFQQALLRTLAERVAALSEVQRELVERELDALRSIALNPGALDPAARAPAGSDPSAAGRG
jgi:hypothetical protein